VTRRPGDPPKAADPPEAADAVLPSDEVEQPLSAVRCLSHRTLHLRIRVITDVVGKRAPVSDASNWVGDALGQACGIVERWGADLMIFAPLRQDP
jgi:hypothetical protein